MNGTRTDDIMLAEGSKLRKALEANAAQNRIAFLVGLPGVGKTLMVQQLAAIAMQLGRKVHLVQWDVARMAFETPELLRRFPEIDGVTHAGIRLAAGKWIRQAIEQWCDTYTDPAHLIIGEAALVGNRFVEIAQPIEDRIEATLAGDQAKFLILTPTLAVRAKIEAARAEEIRNPHHEREAANASIDVLEMLMQEIRSIAVITGNKRAVDKGTGYDPDLYVSVYRKLLRHRHADPVWIDEVLNVQRSPYDIGAIESELLPTADEVDSISKQYIGLYDYELNSRIEKWWQIDN